MSRAGGVKRSPARSRCSIGASKETLPHLFALLGIVEGVDPLAGMDEQIRRRRTQEAVKRILLRESLKQPLMLIFEDLHWIDDETQVFLNLLAECIANAPVLLLVNHRPEYTHQWGSKTYYTQLRLDPLGKESAAEMMSARIGDSPDLAPLKRLVLGVRLMEGMTVTALYGHASTERQQTFGRVCELSEQLWRRTRAISRPLKCGLCTHPTV